MQLTHASLRVDVDTFRGTRDGVPQLLAILDKHRIRASFFFSVGPDNMGRHLWRLFKPKFLAKMLRSDAPALYGWSILLAGTAWPGRSIGRQLAEVIRETDRRMHEVGLHAWDHHAWQTHIGRWSERQVLRNMHRGNDALCAIINRRVDCSATAGWRTDQTVVDIERTFDFRYNSDCRGTSMFRPLLSDGTPGIPQIPVDLPTFDEVVGTQVSASDFNGFILDKFKPGRLNVYTIHAEVEGGVKAQAFDDLLTRARARGIQFRPLGERLPDVMDALPEGRIVPGTVPGREGWVGVQGSMS